MGIFGGFFGNLWLTFDTLNEEYKSLIKKFDTDDFLIFNEKKVSFSLFSSKKPFPLVDETNYSIFIRKTHNSFKFGDQYEIQGTN